MQFRCAGTGSSGNSYALVSDKGEILMIECGIKWKRILKMIDFNTKAVIGCLVTHKHGDHASEFKEILRNGIPIYTNDETADHFEIITGEKMIGRPERIPFKCGSFTIIPFCVPHTTKDKETGKIIPCSNFGYIIQEESMGTLLYMTDMEYCPYSFKGMRPQHLIIECNYINELVDHEQSNYVHRIQGHCSLDTCKGIIRANTTSALKNIILIHLSDTATNEDQILKEVNEIVGRNTEVKIAKPRMAVLLNVCPF